MYGKSVQQQAETVMLLRMFSVSTAISMERKRNESEVLFIVHCPYQGGEGAAFGPWSCHASGSDVFSSFSWHSKLCHTLGVDTWRPCLGSWWVDGWKRMTRGARAASTQYRNLCESLPRGNIIQKQAGRSSSAATDIQFCNCSPHVWICKAPRYVVSNH